MSTKVPAATLAHDTTQFRAFKQAVGIGYCRAECVLNSLVRFVSDGYVERPVALEQAVTQWATLIEGSKGHHG